MSNRKVHWTELADAGIPTLDSEHKTLTEMLDAIFIACQANDNHVTLSLRIDTLIEHVQHHFDREEEIMAAYRYPNIHRHLDEHAKLFIQLSEVLGAIKNDPIRGASEDVRRFLRNSLLVHIEGSDERCAAYIRDAAPPN